VKTNGNDTAAGTSPETAFLTIQKAVDVAIQSDTVIVGDGLYEVSTQVYVTNAITIKSVNGASSTVIDAGGRCRTLFIFNTQSITNRTVIDGFTIKGGNGYNDRLGIFQDGGGIRIDYGGIIRNCVIISNSVPTKGGGLYLHHGGVIENCTIAENTAVIQGGGIVVFDVASRQIRSCILWSNTAPYSANFGVMTGLATNAMYMDRCATTPRPNTSNTYFFVEDPKFIAGTYRLSWDSPCINFGFNANWMTNSQDMDGKTRLMNGIVDVGAYEYNADINITTQPISQDSVVGSNVGFSVVATSWSPLAYQWKKDGNNVGVNSSTHVINGVSLNDIGGYKCVINNNITAVTSVVASLNVYEPPAIIQDPASYTVETNSTVTFSVAATGSEPKTYQWEKDGILISDAKNTSFTISYVKTNNAGEYACEVSNRAGKAKSKNGSLRVTFNIPPIPTPTPIPPTPTPIPPTPTPVPPTPTPVPPTPTPEPPPEPEVGEIIASDGIYVDRIRITWSAVDGANKYQIWRNTKNEFKHAKHIGMADGLTYDDFDINDNCIKECCENHKYYYWVRAIGIPGQGHLLSKFDSGYIREYANINGYADFNSDGRNEYYTFYPTNGSWKISATAAMRKYGNDFVIYNSTFVCKNAFPLVGDYNGDGNVEVGIYNPETYKWFIIKSDGFVVNGYWFGWNNCYPYVYDANNDGALDLCFQDKTTTKYYAKTINGWTICGDEVLHAEKCEDDEVPWGTIGQ
jgi:hypothetical protein